MRPRCLEDRASLGRGFNGGCRWRNGQTRRAEVNYGAAIGLSTPAPRGLGGGASKATPPCVTFRVRCLECGPFKENSVLWEILSLKKKKIYMYIYIYSLWIILCSDGYIITCRYTMMVVKNLFIYLNVLNLNWCVQLRLVTNLFRVLFCCTLNFTTITRIASS